MLKLCVWQWIRLSYSPGFLPVSNPHPSSPPPPSNKWTVSLLANKWPNLLDCFFKFSPKLDAFLGLVLWTTSSTCVSISVDEDRDAFDDDKDEDISILAWSLVFAVFDKSTLDRELATDLILSFLLNSSLFFWYNLN